MSSDHTFPLEVFFLPWNLSNRARPAVVPHLPPPKKKEKKSNMQPNSILSNCPVPVFCQPLYSSSFPARLIPRWLPHCSAPLIQLLPLMHSQSVILQPADTNTNLVSGGHMLTRGGPEYGHLPALPSPRGASVAECLSDV